MFRSILVPLDGHTFGEHALPMALSLARRANAPIKLVHVLQPFVEVVPEMVAYADTMEGEYRREKQEYLDGVVARLREVSEVPVTAELYEGEVVPTLHRVSEDADLMVMTTHGRGPLARFWLGSVADKLVRELRLPLLLLHPGKEAPVLTHEPTFRRILVPLDGTELSEQIVPPAREVARLMKAQTKLLRVVRTEVPPDFGYEFNRGYVPSQAGAMVAEMEAIHTTQVADAERYLKGVGTRLSSIGLGVETKVVFDETPAAAILHEATKDVDLVALATHGYGGLKRLWLGSVADKVIRGATVPILVQRPR